MPKITKDISLSSKPVFIGTPCIFLIYFADEMNVKPGYRPWLVQKCCCGRSDPGCQFMTSITRDTREELVCVYCRYVTVLVELTRIEGTRHCGRLTHLWYVVCCRYVTVLVEFSLTCGTWCIAGT